MRISVIAAQIRNPRGVVLSGLFSIVSPQVKKIFRDVLTGLILSFPYKIKALVVFASLSGCRKTPWTKSLVRIQPEEPPIL